MTWVGRWARVTAGIAGHGPRRARLRRAVEGRIVLVTGASEGIGAATARRLGAAGATVLLVARTADRLEAVRNDIVAAGGTAHVHPADLSRPEAADALGEALLSAYGRVDVVVNNAGRSIRRSIAATADRFHDVQRTIDLNYLGPVALLLALVPAMRAAGGGHVVNVSTAGLTSPAPGWSAYLGSKAAFDYWLRCAAPELRTYGITTSTVYCGLVRTRMSAPTAAFDRLAATSADEAAAVVCRAVAHRRRTLQPWWSRPAELLTAAAKGPVEAGMAAHLR
ncbi:SDR family NAD(P)-dependent oxidoreductase, partial [Luedemannella flava]|uniref:SDR family NAD(P)-dependent oxidoreductase n=1 Tax=Luedemannella flava TaxID=349316 RepID=UPI0031D5C72D